MKDLRDTTTNRGMKMETYQRNVNIIFGAILIVFLIASSVAIYG